jgi:hypothetical protein
MSREASPIAIDDPLPPQWAEDERRPADALPLPPLFLEFPATKAAPTVDGRGGVRVCSSCGKPVLMADEPHVLVARVVRPNNNYGGTGGGQVVYIEASDLSGGALEATMALDEYRAGVRRLMEPRLAAPQKGRVAAMVEQTVEAVAAQTRAQINAAKERAEAELEKTAATLRRMLGGLFGSATPTAAFASAEDLEKAGLAPELLELFKNKPELLEQLRGKQAAPRDLEQPSQPRAAVATAPTAPAHATEPPALGLFGMSAAQQQELEAGNQRLQELITERRRLLAEAKELGLTV